MKLVFWAALGVLLLCGAMTTPTLGFPSGVVVLIPEGVTGEEAMMILRRARVIQFPEPYLLCVRLFSGSHGAKAGGYVFPHPVNAVIVAWQVAHGGNAPTARITIPEGSSVRDMSLIFKDELPGFDEHAFLKAATEHEGYLFPDTYFVVPGTSEDDIIKTMRANFDVKANNLLLSRDDVIMASLLEKEARQSDTRAIVAGILWKRLKYDMPLQVDAVFGYIFGTTTFSPSFDQLKVDSPYNTYTHTGLPPGPINSPGLDAIFAAQHPTETLYWYYLTGEDGTMHYAKTFAEHVENRKYLK